MDSTAQLVFSNRKKPSVTLELANLRLASLGRTSPAYSQIDDETALLCKYVFHKFTQTHSIEQVSCIAKAPTVIGSVIVIASGFISWYPIIIGVMDIGIKSKGFKACLAGGSWISYGGLYAWGTLNVVHELFKKRGPTESALIKNQVHPCLSLSYRSSIAILGVGATLPNAYFAYTFNHQNIGWVIDNMIGSWGICAYPIHTMVIEIREKLVTFGCSRTCIEEKRWNEVRAYLSIQLECLLEQIPKMDFSSLSEIFQQDLTHASETTYTQIFFERVFRKHTENPDPVRAILKSKIIQYPVKIISAILPISNIFANAKATWNLVTTLTQSIIAKAFIIPFALAPSYLTYSLNRDCFLSILQKIISIYLKKDSPSLSGIYYPKSRISMISIAVILSLLSSGVDFATAKEIFSDDTSLDRTAIATSMINSLALTLLPMIELSMILLDKSISCLGNQNFDSKFVFSQKLKELNFFIRHCSQQELKRFVKSLLENSYLRKELRTFFPWMQ